MKRRNNRSHAKMYGFLASLALFVAIFSVNSTCGFMLYQPDVPNELL